MGTVILPSYFICPPSGPASTRAVILSKNASGLESDVVGWGNRLACGDGYHFYVGLADGEVGLDGCLF